MNIDSVKLKKKIAELYKAFALYNVVDDIDMCLACYSPEQIRLLKLAPISEIDTELAKKLLWEASDHWKSANVYKHFLPRILEVMSPPEFEEDLFPAHLVEVLQYLGYNSWPDEEKVVVYNFLEYLAPHIHQDEDDYVDFTKSISLLK